MPDKRPSRTRFDHSRRNIALAVIALVLLLGSTFAGVFVVDSGIGLKRSGAEAPRNFDLWVIYPDDTMRFGTLFYDLPAGEGASDLQSVDVAGPLLRAESDIISADPIGGSLVSSQVYSGAEFINEDGSQIVYPLYTIGHEPNREPYGVEVYASNSPYIALNPVSSNSADRVITLGAPPQEVYNQIIVAIAFPAGTTIVGQEGSIISYRQIDLAGWTIYYYDVTDPLDTDMIRVVYRPADEAPAQPPDIRQVDRRR